MSSGATTVYFESSSSSLSVNSLPLLVFWMISPYLNCKALTEPKSELGLLFSAKYMASGCIFHSLGILPIHSMPLSLYSLAIADTD